MVDAPDDGPPPKRARLALEESSAHRIQSQSDVTVQQDEQVQKEISCGITAFVNPHTATFSGVLKQRYTDFLVNEILPNGTVLHLRDLSAPSNRKPEAQTPRDSTPQQTSLVPPTPAPEQVKEASEKADVVPSPADLLSDDRTALETLFGGECVELVVKLYHAVIKHPQRKPRDFDSVVSPAIEDRQARTEAHQLVRRVFQARLETQTQDDNVIKFTAAPRKQHRPAPNPNRSGHLHGKLGWDEMGGEHVHFTLFKENKDTMECISLLAAESRSNAKRFRFGGTKDRRAVTVQRASAYRIHALELESYGRRLRGAKIGDFSYHTSGLELGQLGGNEFCVALRDCHFPGEKGLKIEARLQLASQTLADSIPAFERDGFINYYGLQRFGSFKSSTDTVGLKMLLGDLRGAVDDILEYSPDALAAARNDSSGPLVSQDDRDRALGLNTWRTTGDSQKALDRIPRKFNAETCLIRALGSKNKAKANDYQGALQTIPRTLRLMYVHAYQSRVWNAVAAERWRMYGSQVVAGDLIVIAQSRDDEPTAGVDVDESGEPIVKPAADDAAAHSADEYTRARPLSEAEAKSGDYSIFDIVLPLPGYDVEYPSNAVGKFYETFMSSNLGGGLDPHNMRRSWKDISLSGGYRSILAKPLFPMSYEVKTYVQEHEQLNETDWERLEKEKHQDSGAGSIEASNGKNEDEDSATIEEKVNIAVILKFSLGPSQYATMALREMMGAGGVRTYQANYGGGRG